MRVRVAVRGLRITVKKFKAEIKVKEEASNCWKVSLIEVDFVEEKAHQEDVGLGLGGVLVKGQGLGIRHLKFYKKRRVLVGFPLKKRGFGH